MMAQRDPMAAALMHRPQAAHVCRDGRWLVCDRRERRGAYAQAWQLKQRRRAEPMSVGDVGSFYTCDL